MKKLILFASIFALSLSGYSSAICDIKPKTECNRKCCKKKKCNKCVHCKKSCVKRKKYESLDSTVVITYGTTTHRIKTGKVGCPVEMDINSKNKKQRSGN